MSNEAKEEFEEANVATGTEENEEVVTPEEDEDEVEEGEEGVGGEDDEDEGFLDDDEEEAEGKKSSEDPEFTFERKIKVMDDEVEIPEHLAGAVKNEEQFKELKELYEKAHGLEPLKQKRDYFKEQATTYETKLKETSTELQNIESNLDFLDKLIKTNDLQTFQQHAKISDDQVLQRASQIIQYRELTPQQKAEYDNNVQSRQRLYSVEAENQRLSQTYEETTVQQSQAALDAVLNSDDFQEVAASFDKRMGYGAFQREVVQRAAYKEHTTGQSMSPEEAVKEVVTVLGLSQSQSETPQTQTTEKVTTQSRTPETTVVTKNKPTIPKHSGGSKSPAKRVVKSLDDIRALANSMDY